MATLTKELASSVLQSYNNSLSRLTSRFLENMNNISKRYSLKKKEIEKEAKDKKNYADASAKIALKNTKASLLEKGLSKSGESVQAELDNSLMKARRMSDIDEESEKSKRANEAEWSNAENAAISNYVTEANALDKARNEAYREELRADRSYEADREDEYYDRYAKNKEFEADREDEYYDRYAKNKEFEADREDEYFDRYMEGKKFEADRDDEYHDRNTESLEDGEGEEKAEDEKIVPEYKAKTLVDKIISNYRMSYSDEKTLKKKVKESINEILNDETIDYSYRYQVKLYAKALGYL